MWRQIVASRSRADWWLITIVIVCLGGFLAWATAVTPYEPDPAVQGYYETEGAPAPPTYLRAQVIERSETTMHVKLLDGYRKGIVEVVEINRLPSSDRLLNAGDTVLVMESSTREGGTVMAFIGHFRIPALAVLLVVFIILVVLIGGRRGAASVLGLLLSILVIGGFIIPFIASEHNAFFIAMVGAYIIAIVSILVSHGVRRRTFISVGCIVLILTMIAALAGAATWLTALSGIADETAFYFSLEKTTIDMRGIVMAGIVIASLGVLDDVVTTQVATVEELHKTDTAQHWTQLFRSASSVGGEHIASLVNTLALAYVGASLPTIIMLSQQHATPLLVTINGEYIATEIVRTLIVSIGLVIAVPISTLTATLIYKRLVQ